MNDLDDLLATALDDLGRQAPHDAALAGTIRRRSRWRRIAVAAPVAVAAAVVAVILAIGLFPSGRGTTVSSHPPSACAPLTRQVLPTWARAGFSDPKPVMPVVFSRTGTMVAIIFANPLVSPALPDLGNKILWVTDQPAAAGEPLRIAGTVEGGTETMRATVDGGPGPSLIDVPVPGCWHFELTWGDHHDSLDIAYAPS